MLHNTRTVVLGCITVLAVLWLIASSAMATMQDEKKEEQRMRARELGVVVGILPTGEHNAITDVAGVKVGHYTLNNEERFRTGVTAILPHAGNMFQQKVPCAIHLGNAFGKLAGYTQVEELGNLETPIMLTGTLNVPRVADGLIEYMIQLPGNRGVRSINPVVGETNDGSLTDIRARPLGAKEVKSAIESAKTGPVAEGCVGAGTGTVCFGFKGGIGTSSRRARAGGKEYTVGVLVQSNFGGILQINGAPVGRELSKSDVLEEALETSDGSCMIVVATDAPLESRNLKRLASRAMFGLARTGSFCSNGSGDYVIAFSTAGLDQAASPEVKELGNSAMSPLFMAVVEATEEAVYNSLFQATTTKGFNGRTVEALPLEKVAEICRKYKVLNWDKSLSR